MLKKISVIGLGVALGLMGLAQAQEPSPHRGGEPEAAPEATGPFGGKIAGTIGFATDYVFRGVSQTQELPAVQGSIEYAYPASQGIDVYAGLWASNVKFNDATAELDISAGVRGTIDKLTYNVSGIYYAYPGAESGLNYDYWDVGFSLAYELPYVTPAVGYRYTPDNFGGSGSSHYPYAEVTVPIPPLAQYNVRLLGHVGYSSIEDNAAFALPDYWDWMVGVGFSAYTLDFMLQYTDTNISDSTCGSGSCGARGVLVVSKSF